MWGCLFVFYCSVSMKSFDVAGVFTAVCFGASIYLLLIEIPRIGIGPSMDGVPWLFDLVLWLKLNPLGLVLGMATLFFGIGLATFHVSVAAEELETSSKAPSTTT